MNCPLIKFICLSGIQLQTFIINCTIVHIHIEMLVFTPLYLLCYCEFANQQTSVTLLLCVVVLVVKLSRDAMHARTHSNFIVITATTKTTTVAMQKADNRCSLRHKDLCGHLLSIVDKSYSFLLLNCKK